MPPDSIWLVVAFIIGMVCWPSTVWLIGRIKTRRIQPPGGTSGLPGSPDEPIREISAAIKQIEMLLRKVCELLGQEREDRDSLIRTLEQRFQEVLRLSGQMVSSLETHSAALRNVEYILESTLTSPVPSSGPKSQGARIETSPEQRPPLPDPPAVNVQQHGTMSSDSLTQTITTHFARIDLETGRHFEDFRKRFQDVLGRLVADIQEEDGAVLFFENNTSAQVWPWPNNTIQKRWREFFSAPKGENAPVREVDKPAIVSRQSDQWNLRRMGVVRQ